MTERIFIKTMPELRTWIGREILGQWMTITQDTIDKFADATGDHQWIHVDVERCKTDSPFKTTIAHGNLTFCLLSAVARNTGVKLPPSKMTINYGANKIRFTGVVPAGSRIRGRYTLADVKDVDGGKQVLLTWMIIGEREGVEKPILIAEILTRRSA